MRNGIKRRLGAPQESHINSDVLALYPVQSYFSSFIPWDVPPYTTSPLNPKP